jgi:hypothetical protein
MWAGVRLVEQLGWSPSIELRAGIGKGLKGTSKNGRFGLEFGVQEDLGRVTAGLGASVGEVLGLGGRRFPVRASFGPRIPLQPLTPPLPS